MPRKNHSKKRVVPPTGSTFVNYGTVRTNVCNLRGYKDDKFFLTNHKKTHGTMGLRKGGYGK